MLDLQARVHLDEVKRAGVDVQQELHGSGMRVAGGTRQRQRRLANLATLRVRQQWRRRSLDDLLVTALYRAVALEQMDQGTVPVPQDLDFDVARPGHEPLEVHRVVAEHGARFASRRLDERRQLARRFHHADAAPAAPPAGLHHEGIADARRELGDLPDGARQRRGRSQDRQAGAERQGPRRDLVPERAQDLFRRADEYESGARARRRELGPLGQKAVARVNGIDARPARHADDVVHVAVGLDRRAPGDDEIALVGGEAVERAAVLVGVDGDRPQLQLLGGADDADGDLAAVGDEQTSNASGPEGAAAAGREISHGRVTPAPPASSDRARR